VRFLFLAMDFFRRTYDCLDFLTLAIVSEIIGSTGLKASKVFIVLFPSALVVLGYSAAFYFISLALKSIALNTAYAS
jgi:multidrug transporter EmrE-like cation transporter